MYKQTLELNSCKIPIRKRKPSDYFLEERFSHISWELSSLLVYNSFPQKYVGEKLKEVQISTPELQKTGITKYSLLVPMSLIKFSVEPRQ